MGRTGRIALLVLLVVALATGGAAGGWFGVSATRQPQHPVATTPAPPAVLAEATAAPTPVPTAGAATPTGAARAAAVAQRLDAALGSPALGNQVFAEVLDAQSGVPLLSRRPDAPAPPASTAKLLTAAAVLSEYPATQQFPTLVVQGAAAGTVVLVGGGDPTLTAAAPGRSGAYPDAARISDLAAALRSAHVPVRRIVVDSSLFGGPAVAPQWAPEDVPSDYAAPITALMVDGGRDTPSATIRGVDPDLAAGHALAAALGAPKLPVTRGTAPAGAAQLAEVRSAPLSVLVEQMLEQSDNVIAECLARQVAIAHGDPATFAGAVAAIRSVLATDGVTERGTMYDGSGLAAADRLDAGTLTAVLRLSVRTPKLRPLLAGLPVAGWSGTLDDRFVTGSATAAAGDVRAKTGTLTAVSTLAGLVHTRSGQLLVFAVLADRVPPSYAGTLAAEAALDRVAAALAGCGCG